jgi:hypothetical protein
MAEDVVQRALRNAFTDAWDGREEELRASAAPRANWITRSPCNWI